MSSHLASTNILNGSDNKSQLMFLTFKRNKHLLILPNLDTIGNSLIPVSLCGILDLHWTVMLLRMNMSSH